VRGRVSGFPGSPKLLKGGIVLVDPGSGVPRAVIALQYNPDSLSRSFQVQSVSEGGDRSEALRLKGPPVETYKLEAELDLTDLLEFPDLNADAVRLGLHPQLAALELTVYPTSTQLSENNRLAGAGVLEIAPMESPLTLFVWSEHRVVPVRITELSITEEAFDVNLNPIRAKVSLGMRVLNVNDLGFNHQGGSLFMRHLQQKEQFAARVQGQLSQLGLSSLP
jgi:hypothetical protein